MALHWYWKNVIGELVYKDGSKKQIYGGNGCNCLGVLGYLARADDFGQPLPKPRWTVIGEFWNDREHLERCLGIRKLKTNYQHGNIYEDVKKVRLNTFFDKKMLLEIAIPFIKTETTVEFYHKEIKK